MRKLILSLTVMLLALASIAPVAQADYLLINGGSWHEANHGGGAHFNGRNPGLGYERPINKNWSIEAGQYRNSFYRESYYATGSYQPLQSDGVLGNVKFGLVAGLVSGYQPGLRGSLKVMPELTYTYGKVGINMITLIYPGHSIIAGQVKFQIF